MPNVILIETLLSGDEARWQFAGFGSDAQGVTERSIRPVLQTRVVFVSTETETRIRGLIAEELPFDVRPWGKSLRITEH